MFRFNKSLILYRVPLILVDIACILASLLFVALLSETLLLSALSPLEIIPVAVITAIVSFIMGTHRISLSHAGFRDISRVALSVSLSSMIEMLVIIAVFSLEIPFLEFICTALMAPAFSVVFRLLVRSGLIRRRKSEKKSSLKESGDAEDYANTLIIGAGAATEILLGDIYKDANFYKCKPVAIIDDNPTLHGTLLRGVEVVGARDYINEAVKKYNVKTIIFAIPSASQKDRQDILKRCSASGCRVLVMPAVGEALNMAGSAKAIRKVNIYDLLGRDAVDIDINKIVDYVREKTVLVTGAGGSIGSEICRQIASKNPRRLVLFDIYENSTFEVLNELKRRFPTLDVMAYIGSVRDRARMEDLFERERPSVVYHAAAHKHVPLMEDSPHEAVKNNVFGTLNTVMASDKYGVERFVMISTDKAVNPTNIMGATKRVCEMIIQAYNKHSKTDFVAVRFGNVLGSNGSVIPIFEKQIAEGGPVTVTDPNIIRYFMTIPEAVLLVLSAGALAKGGEIFVLDMGEPVKILDLAENMIKLSGFVPYRDIDIKFTGLRPGEKLYEELLMREEGLQKTENSLIYIGKPMDIEWTELKSALDALYASATDEKADVRAALHAIVPTFKEAE